MADIFHQFPIKASGQEVFEAFSTPSGLDVRWTKQSAGKPVEGAEYKLWFGPPYDWRAVVSRCIPDREFEFMLTHADEDWQGTCVGFVLEEQYGLTQLRFHHTGWPKLNEHYCISNCCWAAYLRLLRRYLEHGEVVPYEDRLEV